MLELSLRGDLGLLGLRTLWKNDCTLPMESCKKSYSMSLSCVFGDAEFKADLAIDFT